MTTAHINRIGTALPPLDIHRIFVDFMNNSQLRGKFDRVFNRMVERSGIFHRYSVLPLDAAFDRTDASRLLLRAGQISLHRPAHAGL